MDGGRGIGIKENQEWKGWEKPALQGADTLLTERSPHFYLLPTQKAVGGLTACHALDGVLNI